MSPSLIRANCLLVLATRQGGVFVSYAQTEVCKQSFMWGNRCGWRGSTGRGVVATSVLITRLLARLLLYVSVLFFPGILKCD